MKIPDYSFCYSNITWLDIENYFKNNDIVIVPTGSCEQHGRHLPLCTDTIVPEYISNIIGEKEKILVLPTLPFGHSSNHDCFPGTISISPHTYTLFIKEIIVSLIKHGASKFIFINGHSGNTPSLRDVSNFIREKNKFSCIVEWYSIVGQINEKFKLSGHADFTETSAVLAINPSLVKLDDAKPYKPKSLTSGMHFISWDRLMIDDVIFYTWTKTCDASDTGHFGTLENSSAETGKEIFSLVNDFLSKLIYEIKQLDLSCLKKF